MDYISRRNKLAHQGLIWIITISFYSTLSREIRYTAQMGINQTPFSRNLLNFHFQVDFLCVVVAVLC